MDKLLKRLKQLKKAATNLDGSISICIHPDSDRDVLLNAVSVAPEDSPKFCESGNTRWATFKSGNFELTVFL